MICLILTLFSTYTATATTIYYDDDGDYKCTWIDITGEKRMEWISVEDELPRIGEIVLVCDVFNDFVTLGRLNVDPEDHDNALIYTMHIDHVENDSVVTHWMPLPATPTIKDGNE
jgi:hypothetical protein